MNWSVAVTAPNSEQRAIRNLQRQKFECYFPRCEERGRLMPLFPRYIFIAIKEQWHSILGTIGISSLLLSNGKPALLGDEVISDIRAREDANGIVKLSEHFVVGQRLNVTEGLFAGCNGIYLSMPSSDRVVVLLSLLGRKVRVTVPAAHVE